MSHDRWDSRKVCEILYLYSNCNRWKAFFNTFCPVLIVTFWTWCTWWFAWSSVLFSMFLAQIWLFMSELMCFACVWKIPSPYMRELWRNFTSMVMAKVNRVQLYPWTCLHICVTNTKIYTFQTFALSSSQSSLPSGDYLGQGGSSGAVTRIVSK